MAEKIDRVLNHLYIGSLFSLSPKNIKNANIRLIIDCTVEGSGRCFSGVEKLQVPIDDTHNANIGLYFDICADRIDLIRVDSIFIFCYFVFVPALVQEMFVSRDDFKSCWLEEIN